MKYLLRAEAPHPPSLAKWHPSTVPSPLLRSNHAGLGDCSAALAGPRTPWGLRTSRYLAVHCTQQVLGKHCFSVPTRAPVRGKTDLVIERTRGRALRPSPRTIPTCTHLATGRTASPCDGRTCFKWSGENQKGLKMDSTLFNNEG